MKLGDLIWVSENELSPDFCNHVIQKFESDTRKYEGRVIGDGTGADYNIKKKIKISTDLQITGLSEWEYEDNVFYESLRIASKKYMSYCDSISPKLMSGFYYDDLHHHSMHDTGYQIQRTKPSEFYEWHTDWYYDNLNGFRNFTYIWYLNDILYDGETEFIDGTKIKPQTGKLLIFPATWVYVHRGISPKSETKYIVTGWISQKFNFMD